MLTYELAFGMSKKVLDNFISFTESLGSPLLDAYISLVMVKTSDCCAAVQISIHALGDYFSLLLLWLNMFVSS